MAKLRTASAPAKKTHVRKKKIPSTAGKPKTVVSPMAKKKATKSKPKVKLTQVRLKHVDEFFAKFREFKYNPFGHPSSEFKRLCNNKGWSFDKDFEAREARREFQTALVKQFNTTFGMDENKLEGWQRLCRTLQYPVPETLNECRKLVMDTHVNLVDLLANKNTGRVVHKFLSEVALSEYTKRTEKIFPRKNIEAGSLLKKLLRHIFDPSIDRGSSSRGGYGRGNGARGRGRGQGG